MQDEQVAQLAATILAGMLGKQGPTPEFYSRALVTSAVHLARLVVAEVKATEKEA